MHVPIHSKKLINKLIKILILSGFATYLHERHEPITGRMNWKGQEDKMVGKKKCTRFRNVVRTKRKKNKRRKIQANTIRWGQNNINHKFSRQKET